MFPHRIKTSIAQKGILHLEALPFEPDDKVEITILKQNAATPRGKKRIAGEYAGKIRISG
uniref:Uncharacterized protein n=1 Tax=Candidatus Kentrum eta TaxID=2126337 RepID=A0A450VF78_9GAMM|nr:MAG: hypothetical protein BECKH772A_GA0070896_101237 [Candidatus Kentron sp. H]VFJ97939.1 MAG: hypothetical protein BECKH772B_GA0070898_101228 [Candidatus Kentron sp. H]VFK03434.1 MAG: hypothetical protein BECKH772C_GA0070978_101292 [Candidatus Kentron sp. H]